MSPILNAVALSFIIAAGALLTYVWLVYPMLLWITSAPRRDSHLPGEKTLPHIAIVIAAHNAAHVIRATLSALLRSDYPPHRRAIFVVSDASTDETPQIVRAFRSAGVTLIDSRTRRGKTGAENLVLPRLDSDIVVFMDANVQVAPASLSALVREFSHRDIGVVSGMDRARARRGTIGIGERAYTRFEMWLRSRESNWSGLVGASGCLYAVRRELVDHTLSSALTRDFASVLMARRRGLRAVIAPDASCQISTSAKTRAEFARKARTITQGIATLMHFRDLMNPFRYGRFAVALISHKLSRWILPPVLAAALLAGAFLLLSGMSAAAQLSVLGVLLACALLARVRESWLRIVEYCVLVSAATLIAWTWFFRGRQIAVWRPTYRGQSPLRVDVRVR